MKNRKGIVWAPVLIMIGVVVITGIASYYLIQAGDDKQTENKNIAVANQTNGDINENINDAFNANRSVNNNASVNTNTSANTNAESNTDATTGWKTYTNSKYSFSFKHPSDWKLEEVSVINNGACARAPSTDSVFCVIPDGSTTDDGNVISTETVTVSGQTAKHTVRKNLGGTNLPNYDYYVFTSYRLHGWTANNNITVEPKSSSDLDTLTNILSTFQFTN